MKYALLIYSQEEYWTSQTPQEQEEMIAAYGAFSQEVQEAGVLVAAEPLVASKTATTVRVRNEKPLRTDGPFAETKEQLGGFYLLDCENLDMAIEYAAKIPTAKFGTIEVRPVVEFEGPA